MSKPNIIPAIVEILAIKYTLYIFGKWSKASLILKAGPENILSILADIIYKVVSVLQRARIFKKERKFDDYLYFPISVQISSLF